MLRFKKIGTVTVGVSFLIIGVAIFMQNWISFSFIQFLSYLWPLLLIMLGLEYIYKRRKNDEEEPRPFDGFAITILFLVLLISGGLFSLNTSDWTDPFAVFGDNWRSTVELEETYDVNNVQSITFSFTNANIEIIGEETNDIQISGVIKSLETDEEKVLEIYEKERKIKKNENSFEYIVTPPGSIFSMKKNFSLDITLKVPSHVKLDLKSTNGELVGKNIHGDVVLKTTNGQIHASSMKGNIEAKSTNGAITVKDVGGAATVKTTNGNITVENVKNKLLIKTTNGGITVKSNEVNGDWQASTTNGRVTMTLPQTASVKIDAKTTNGSVKGNFDWERRYEGSRKNRQGSAIMNEGEFQVMAESTNGSIVINHE